MEADTRSAGRDPAPACPKCGSSMVMRTTKRGKNIGNQFWGCSTFPDCWKRIPISDQTRGNTDADASGGAGEDRGGGVAPVNTKTKSVRADRSEEALDAAAFQRRVDWADGTFNRRGWTARHASAGGSLRALPDACAVQLGCCWVAREDRGPRQAGGGPPPLSLAVGSMLRLLARGTSPPMHPDAEKRLMSEHDDGVASAVEDRDFLVPARGAAVFAEGMCDSDFEELLVEQIDARRSGAARWLVPQAPLDVLAVAAGVENAEAQGERRCDFLFCPLGSEPVVFEVDGSQHEEAQLVDRERDTLLRNAGIPTVRVTTEELRAGKGPGLEGVFEATRKALAGRNSPNPWHPLVWGPLQTHRLMLAICESADAGFLSGERWVIELSDPTGLSAGLIGPYLETLAALADIWGAGDSVPKVVTFRGDDVEVVYRRDDDGGLGYEQTHELGTSDGTASVVVLLQSDWSPSEQLPRPDLDGPPLVVVRSTGVPVLPRDPVRLQTAAHPGQSNKLRLRQPALEAVMRAVFAKDRFREGQLEGVSAVLAGRDCAVLLPTGGGKSMIYQMTGLILPGRVLVVDPITSLIDDQISGLAEHGIDRACGITSRNSGESLDTTKDAYFVFVAPERLQRQKFRDLLAASARSFPVSLVVVDEAHCVSEWGHDFRTAYLNFGRTVRTVCDPSGLGAPPILALTGTASRAVLSDVLFQLGISGDSPDSIISPASFDRPELTYEVRRTSPNLSEETLKDVLRCIPAELGEQPAAFQVEGRLPGIVFIPTVDGPRRNMRETLKTVRSAIPTAAGFSSKAPNGWNRIEWEDEKTRNAQMFKADRTGAIVATKAYGMGIDKPNVRWIVHYGLPQSIESFYQEVGRAGRDHQPAKSVLILTEHSQAQSRAQLESGQQQQTNDDISTVLWFHNRSFPNPGGDAQTTEELFRRLCANSIIPLGDQEEKRNASKRALHRLAILGVVDDYCIKGFGNTETATVSVSLNISPEQIADNLLGFVARSQPGRVEAFRERVSTYANAQSAVRECSRMLAEFVYDTIGRARQRSLYEMWELAGSGIQDGELVRQGILDYLTEGVPSAVAQRLAEMSKFSFADWVAEWNGIASVDDARQWRAAAARLLGSYPDHPGLLASRALAGLLLPDGSADDLEEGLRQSMDSALNRYQADPSDTEDLAMQIIGMVTDPPESEMASVIASKPRDEQLTIASAAVAAARATLPTCERVNEWLETNWQLSPHLAVFRLSETIASANRFAHQITSSNGTSSPQIQQPEHERTVP